MLQALSTARQRMWQVAADPSAGTLTGTSADHNVQAQARLAVIGGCGNGRTARVWRAFGAG